MKLTLKFSLSSVFVLTAAIATIVFYMPMEIVVFGDFRGTVVRGFDLKRLSVNDRVDIQGRQENGSFETVVEDVHVIALARSETPSLGSWKVKFRSNLRTRSKLSNFSILRFQHSRTKLELAQ